MQVLSHPNFHNVPQLLAAGKRVIRINAAPQERNGYMFFIIAGDDYDRLHGKIGANRLVINLGNPEIQFFDFVENIVGKITWCLVNLINQHDRSFWTVMNELVRQSLLNRFFLIC